MTSPATPRFALRPDAFGRRPVNRGSRNMLRSILHKLVVAGAAVVALVAVDTAPAFADDDDFGLGADMLLMDSPSSVVRAIKVGLNKSVVIDLPRDARDILVSNPVIADAVIRTPRRIYVTGVAVGQSNVIIFDRAGQQILLLDLEVERDNLTLTRMLNRLLPDSAIDVEVVSDNIVLTGSVRNAADARKAEDIAGVFANAGALGGRAQNEVVSSVINMLSIEGEDQVHLKVTVAEVQRSVAKQLGIQMNGAINIGPIAATFNSDPPFGVAGQPLSNSYGLAGAGDLLAGLTNTNNGIAATISALEQTGMIKTLAEPTLTAISGESASFLAGGEFPVPVGRDADTNSVTIAFKPFGVALSFTPVVLSEGRISLRVKTEVSELTTEGSITLSDTTIPGLKVRRAESTLELPSGGSMVLGGLIQDSVRQSVAALPGLGSLPILGTLFRSRDFQRSETELVIIVTPYLVSPVARSALATPDQGFQPASDAQAMFLGNINRVYGGPSDKAAAYAMPTHGGGYGFIFE
jgi:pilus assembly protein CpaC